jgi:hypothetical protein
MKASKFDTLTPQTAEGIMAIEWILAPYSKVLKSQTYSSIVDIVSMLLL